LEIIAELIPLLYKRDRCTIFSLKHNVLSWQAHGYILVLTRVASDTGVPCRNEFMVVLGELEGYIKAGSFSELSASMVIKYSWAPVFPFFFMSSDSLSLGYQQLACRLSFCLLSVLTLHKSTQEVLKFVLFTPQILPGTLTFRIWHLTLPFLPSSVPPPPLPISMCVHVHRHTLYIHVHTQP
jgi:hypothetical protein